MTGRTGSSGRHVAVGDVSVTDDDVVDADPAAVRREIVSAVLTLAIAISVIGFVFGVGVVSAGGSVPQACLMSMLVFTGASQFSAVSVVASGGTTGAALGGAMLLAARNMVYGLALSRILGPRFIGGSLPSRVVAAQITIDETTAMATAQ